MDDPLKPVPFEAFVGSKPRPPAPARPAPAPAAAHRSHEPTARPTVGFKSPAHMPRPPGPPPSREPAANARNAVRSGAEPAARTVGARAPAGSSAGGGAARAAQRAPARRSAVDAELLELDGLGSFRKDAAKRAPPSPAPAGAQEPGAKRPRPSPRLLLLLLLLLRARPRPSVPQCSPGPLRALLLPLLRLGERRLRIGAVPLPRRAPAAQAKAGKVVVAAAANKILQRLVAAPAAVRPQQPVLPVRPPQPVLPARPPAAARSAPATAAAAGQQRRPAAGQQAPAQAAAAAAAARRPQQQQQPEGSESEYSEEERRPPPPRKLTGRDAELFYERNYRTLIRRMFGRGDYEYDDEGEVEEATLDQIQAEERRSELIARKEDRREEELLRIEEERETARRRGGKEPSATARPPSPAVPQQQQQQQQRPPAQKAPAHMARPQAQQQVQMSAQAAATASPLAGMKIALIGAGVMGEAILKALLRSHAATPDQLYVAEFVEERAREIGERYGVRTTTEVAEAVPGADVVVLATKPQNVEAVFGALRAARLSPEALLFSICAGVTLARLRAGAGAPETQRVVRAMPNTPAQIGRGISVWTASDNLSGAQAAAARAVLGALGDEVRVGEEGQLDMATALSGTGPAYVLLFVEALVDAGVHMGFQRPVAERLVLQTIRGTAEYAMACGRDTHVAALRNQVTSPAGTTAAALYEMERGGLRTVVSDAVWAAYTRSQELGRAGPAPHPPQHTQQ
eukprot:m51a1_g9080 putative pyrroline-5-carboxylate reductase (744) ;mRNA; f:22214-25275